MLGGGFLGEEFLGESAGGSTGQTVVIGQAVEIDSARPITPSIARATERDTAGGISRPQFVPVAQALETDVARTINPDKEVALARAVETDTASALVPQIGRAVEIDSARPITQLVPLLYAAKAGSVGTSDLYLIDPLTGDETAIGPIGCAVTGLAFDPTNGDLYGSTSNNSTVNKRSLILIDKSTGAGTLVGAFGLSPANTCADIAFDSTGQLYGWSEATDDLVTINKSTGVATVVANSGISTLGDGMDFFSDDRLLLMQETNDNFYWVDKSTGVATLLGFLEDAFANDFPVAAGSFGPDGLFYAVITEFGSPVHFVTIDYISGAITVIGTTADNIDALAWDTQVRPPFPEDPAQLDPGDDFADRVTLSGESGEVLFDNTGFTVEGAETNPMGHNGTTGWYEWTAPSSGLYRLATTPPIASSPGVGDTQLTVYQGSVLASLTLVELNDDRDADFYSELLFEAVSAQTYVFRVGGYDGAEGFGILEWEKIATTADNDDFANATAITGATTTFQSDAPSNRYATAETDEDLSSATDDGRQTWWWLYTADADLGPGAQLRFYSGYLNAEIAVADAADVTSVDDFYANATTAAAQTGVFLASATNGQQFIVRLETKRYYGAVPSSAARIALRYVIIPPTPPANNSFSNAVSVLDGNTYSGTLVGATADNPGSGGTPATKNVWYLYKVQGIRDVTVQLSDVSGFSPRIQVFRGLPNGAGLTFVAGADASSLTYTQSINDPASSSSARYFWISIDTADGNEGTFDLEIVPDMDADSYAMSADAGSYSSLENSFLHAQNQSLNNFGSSIIANAIAFGPYVAPADGALTLKYATTLVGVSAFANTDMAIMVKENGVEKLRDSIQMRNSSATRTVTTRVTAGRSYTIYLGYGSSTSLGEYGHLAGLTALQWWLEDADLVTDAGGSFTDTSATLDAFPTDASTIGVSFRFTLTSSGISPGAVVARCRCNDGTQMWLIQVANDMSLNLSVGTTIPGTPSTGNLGPMSRLKDDTETVIEVWLSSGKRGDVPRPPNSSFSDTAIVAWYGITVNGIPPKSVATSFMVKNADYVRYLDYGIVSGSGSVTVSDIRATDDPQQMPLTKSDSDAREVYLIHGWEAGTRGAASRSSGSVTNADFLEARSAAVSGIGNVQPQIASMPIRGGSGMRCQFTGATLDTVSSARWGDRTLDLGTPAIWATSSRFAYSFYFYLNAYPSGGRLDNDDGTVPIARLNALILEKLDFGVGNTATDFGISVGIAALDSNGMLYARTHYNDFNSDFSWKREPTLQVTLNEVHHCEVLIDLSVYKQVVMYLQIDGCLFGPFYPNPESVLGHMQPFEIEVGPTVSAIQSGATYFPTSGGCRTFDGYFDDVVVYDPNLFPLGGHRVYSVPIGATNETKIYPDEWEDGVNQQEDFGAELGYDWGGTGSPDATGFTAGPIHGVSVIVPPIVGPDSWGPDVADGEEPADSWDHVEPAGFFTGKNSMKVEAHFSEGIYDTTSGGHISGPNVFRGGPNDEYGWYNEVPYTGRILARQTVQDGNNKWEYNVGEFTVAETIAWKFDPTTDAWRMFEPDFEKLVEPDDDVEWIWLMNAYDGVGGGPLTELSTKQVIIYKYFVRGPERVGAWASDDGGATWEAIDPATAVQDFLGSWPPQPGAGNMFGLWLPRRGWGRTDDLSVSLTPEAQDTDVIAVRQYLWGHGTFLTPPTYLRPDLGETFSKQVAAATASSGIRRQLLVLGSDNYQVQDGQLVGHPAITGSEGGDAGVSPVQGVRSEMLAPPGSTTKWTETRFNGVEAVFYQTGVDDASWAPSNNWGDVNYSDTSPLTMQALMYEVLVPEPEVIGPCMFLVAMNWRSSDRAGVGRRVLPGR